MSSLSMSGIYQLLYKTGLYRFLWHSNQPLVPLQRWHHAGLLKGKWALDVGCGTGTHALWLAEQGYSVVAVDFSEEALRQVDHQARARRLPIQVLRLDVTRPSPPLPRFDLVVDRECLQDLRHPGLREQYARNLHQWLAPGGAYVVSAWLLRPGALLSLHPVVPDGMIEALLPELQLEERDLSPARERTSRRAQAVYRFRART